MHRDIRQVPRFAQRRSVDPDGTSGVTYLVNKMDELGYCGVWAIANANEFFLPQDRARCWMLFLRRRTPSEAERQQRQRDALKALQVVRDLQSPGQTCEVLNHVLSRLPNNGGLEPASSGSAGRLPKRQRQRLSGTWQEENDKFARKCKLQPCDLEGRDSWSTSAAVVSAGLTERAADVLFLRLAVARKQGADWRQPDTTLVVAAGTTVSWSSATLGSFPCVTPGGHFVLAGNGDVRVASGLAYLAVQGVQGPECEAFGLSKAIEDRFLRDLAGNAFASNACLAFLLAGLSQV